MAAFLRIGLASLALAGASAAGGRDSPAVATPSFEAAPIAFLIDLTWGQVLFERDVGRRFIPASITKAMTLYLAFEKIGEGELSVDDEFAFSEEAASEWRRTGSTMFLENGAVTPVDDLLRGIAAVSANDAAIVLAEGSSGSVEAWVSQMNDTARELGMRDTHFGTPNGWPDSGGTFTTARDLAILGRALATEHPQLYTRYIGLEGLRYNGFAQANHDPISGVVDGADGIKTGFTSQAGHGFLGSAERNGRRLVMVIAAIETEGERATIARQMIEWGFAGFSVSKLFDKGGVVGEVSVQDGMVDRIPVRAQVPINATFPEGQEGAVALKLQYEGPLKAPIRKGEKVAELEISIGGLPPSRVPLVADMDVAQAHGWQRLLNGLNGIVS